MNYYSILRIPHSASQMEIDRAYQRMVKEASYDTRISRKEIELAYRTLRDPTQRALYDYSLSEDKKKLEQTTRQTRKETRRKTLVGQLRILLVVMLVIFLGFFVYRYGYTLKSFSPGDEVYFKQDNKYLGKVIKDEEYAFGNVRKQAYLIEKENGVQIWLPAKDVKSTCYKGD